MAINKLRWGEIRIRAAGSGAKKPLRMKSRAENVIQRTPDQTLVDTGNIVYYEIQLWNAPRNHWDTMKTARTEKKALKTAKQYEVHGRVRVFKRSSGR